MEVLPLISNLSPMGAKCTRKSEDKSRRKLLSGKKKSNVEKASVASIFMQTMVSNPISTAVIPESKLQRIAVNEFSPRKKYFDDSSTCYESISATDFNDGRMSVLSTRGGGNSTVRTTSRGNHTSRTSVAEILENCANKDNCSTLRDMLHDIQIKAELGESPPDFVLALNELPKNCISWNGRVRNIPLVPIEVSSLNRSASLDSSFTKSKAAPRSNSPKSPTSSSTIRVSKSIDEVSMMSTVRFTVEDEGHYENKDVNSMPVINNIGCNRPLELILSRAYTRCRKHISVKQALDNNIEAESSNLLKQIEYRSTRSERYAEYYEHVLLLSVWMKILRACQYSQLLHQAYITMKEDLQYENQLHLAGQILKGRIVYLIRRTRQRAVDRYEVTL